MFLSLEMSVIHWKTMISCGSRIKASILAVKVFWGLWCVQQEEYGQGTIY